MKSLIIFNLDGTLAESKSDLEGEMATLLARLLGIVDVAIISGGAWDSLKKQALAFLSDDETGGEHGVGNFRTYRDAGIARYAALHPQLGGLMSASGDADCSIGSPEATG